MTATTRTPTVGTGATCDFGRGSTDTVPYVVTRVSPSGKTLWARRVELDESTGRNEWEPAEGEPPVRLTDGDLTKPYGDEHRFSLRVNGYWQRGDRRLYLGEAHRRVDHRM